MDYGTSYTYYTTTDVNLRSAPGTDSSVVNSVGSGTALTVVGETDNWYVAVVNGPENVYFQVLCKYDKSGNRYPDAL